MTTATKRIEQPVQFREIEVLACDGCGLEVENPNVGLGARLGWLQQLVMDEDGKGGVATARLADFCKDCRPKIERALKQETDAIKAEVLAAAADISGIE